MYHAFVYTHVAILASAELRIYRAWLKACSARTISKNFFLGPFSCRLARTLVKHLFYREVSE